MSTLQTLSKIRFPLAAGICGLVLLASLPTDSAWAQRGGRDNDRRGERDDDDNRRRGRDRGDDDDRRRGRDRDDDDDDDRRRGRDRRGSDQDRQQWLINRLDANGDGRIERSEVRDRRMWGYFERLAEEAGIEEEDADGLAVSQFLTARKRLERNEQREDNPTAFLPPVEAPPAPGFDTPLSETELVLLNPDRQRGLDALLVSAEAEEEEDDDDEDRRDRRRGRWGRWGRNNDDDRDDDDDDNRSTRSSRTNSGGSGGDDKAERYSNNLLEEYDKNGNRILEQDEWREMRGDDPERYDLNKDGRITKDELLRRFDSDRERSSGSGDGDGANQRSSYRFAGALERLPDDARRWIERLDRDGDGQVFMAEFTRSWTESKVREFKRYDLNGDGIITGAEYMAARER